MLSSCATRCPSGRCSAGCAQGKPRERAPAWPVLLVLLNPLFALWWFFAAT